MRGETKSELFCLSAIKHAVKKEEAFCFLFMSLYLFYLSVVLLGWEDEGMEGEVAKKLQAN